MTGAFPGVSRSLVFWPFYWDILLLFSSLSPLHRSLGNGRLYLCEVPAAFADMRLQIQPSSGPGKGVGQATYK